MAAIARTFLSAGRANKPGVGDVASAAQGGCVYFDRLQHHWVGGANGQLEEDEGPAASTHLAAIESLGWRVKDTRLLALLTEFVALGVVARLDGAAEQGAVSVADACDDLFWALFSFEKISKISPNRFQGSPGALKLCS